MVQSTPYFNQCNTSVAPIPIRFLHVPFSKILKIILLFYVSLLLVVVHCTAAQQSTYIYNKRETPSSSREILSTELKLIEEDATLISENETTKGFEVVVKRFNETEDATLFSSVHLPDHIIRHSGADDEGRKVIILPNDPEMKVAFRNVTTFIVLKALTDSLHRYSTHLAYTRNFGEKVSLEWDVYSFHFHNNNNDSFVQAFIPVRDGPSTITIGLGYTLTRSRREDEDELIIIFGNSSTLPPTINNDYQARSEKSAVMVTTDEASSFTPTQKDKRGFSSKHLKTPSELLDLSKLEMKDESNVDHTRLKKSDSDAKDLFLLDVPYIGIGDCVDDFLQIPFGSPLPTDKIKLIQLFLKILKSECSKTIMKKTLQLFDDNLVIFNGPDNITINRKNSFFTKKILGEMEWIDFASAILLSKFSNVFGEQHNKFMLNQTDNKAPDGKRISGTIRTLTIFTTRILDSLQSTENHHAIKFANLFLIILQAKRSELVTGADELVKCNKCMEEKEVNFNDQVQLYVMMRFIADNLPDIVASSSKTEELFDTFFINNVILITPFVQDKIPFMY